MKTIPDSKYHLRDLNREISLYDRKINHCQNYESFESQAERAATIAKLEAKRESLLETARGMISRGVEYNANELPQSMKSTETAKEIQ